MNTQEYEEHRMFPEGMPSRSSRVSRSRWDAGHSMEARDESLWRLGLDWLREANGGGVHPLDRDRARQLARGMRMVGEHPQYREVSRYIGHPWEPWPYAASMTRDCWRSAY